MALQGAFTWSSRLPCRKVQTSNVTLPSCLVCSARCGAAKIARARDCAVQATPLGNSRTTLLDEPAESEDGYLSERPRGEAVTTYDDDLARNPGTPQVAFVSLADGVFTVRGSLSLDISPDAIYELLTDYASCQRVFKNIASSEVIHTAAGLEVIQVGQGGVRALAVSRKDMSSLNESRAVLGPKLVLMELWA